MKSTLGEPHDYSRTYQSRTSSFRRFARPQKKASPRTSNSNYCSCRATNQTINCWAKISDAVARTVGSWKFIIIQSVCIMGWITYNSVNNANVWDPYPFILLNLMLSFQAAYTAPAIMMSQNRLSEIDRQHANNDFEVNVKAELEIELLHQKIDMMKEKELYALTKAVEALSEKLDGYRR
jgi:uncharacterized membrane protein